MSNAAEKARNSMDKLADKAKMITNVGFAFQHAAALVGRFTSAMDACVQVYEEESVATKKLETLMLNNVDATAEQIQSIKDLTAAQQDWLFRICACLRKSRRGLFHTFSSVGNLRRGLFCIRYSFFLPAFCP
jgi:hypothetical protein